MPQYKIKRTEKYSSNEAEPSLLVYLYLISLWLDREHDCSTLSTRQGREQLYLIDREQSIAIYQTWNTASLWIFLSELIPVFSMYFFYRGTYLLDKQGHGDSTYCIYWTRETVNPSGLVCLVRLPTISLAHDKPICPLLPSLASTPSDWLPARPLLYFPTPGGQMT